jgi:hypothetical protein
MQEKLKAVGLTPSIIKSLGLAVEQGCDEETQVKMRGEDTVNWINKASETLKYDEKYTPAWKHEHPEDAEDVRDAVLQALKTGLSNMPGDWFTMVNGSEKTFRFDEDGIATVMICKGEEEYAVRMKVNLELLA